MAKQSTDPSVVIVAVVASRTLFIINTVAVTDTLPTDHFAVVAGEVTDSGDGFIVEDVECGDGG